MTINDKSLDFASLKKYKVDTELAEYYNNIYKFNTILTVIFYNYQKGVGDNE